MSEEFCNLSGSKQLWVKARQSWRTTRLVRVERDDGVIECLREATITPEGGGYRLKWRAAVGVLISAHPLFETPAQAAAHFDRMTRDERHTLRSMRNKSRPPGMLPSKDRAPLRLIKS